MERAQKENEALQAQWDALASQNFPKGFLEDTSFCPHCGGLGYVGKEMCSCLKELCRQEQLEEVKKLSCGQAEFSDFRLEYYSDRIDPKIGVSPRQVMERNFRTCRSYASLFSQNSGNLLFIGGTGLGKTFLSACIAKTVADRGYSVVYETASHLFSKLERARFNGDADARRETENYTKCDLLIIDDLGTEMGGQFTTAALYSVINDRLLRKKATIISTNLTVDELSRRYNPQIASRLRGGYTRVAFLGDDIRVVKNRRM